VSLDYELIQTDSTIKEVVYDKNSPRGIVTMIRLDYGSAENKKKFLLFEKLASPWIPITSTTPRAGYMDSYYQDAEIEGLTGNEMEQSSVLKAMATGAPAKDAERVVKGKEVFRDYSASKVTSFFIPKRMKDEKIRNSIVKKLVAAGFPEVNNHYGRSFQSPTYTIQMLTMTDDKGNGRIPKEAIKLDDLSKVQFIDKLDNDKKTSFRQKIDKNKKEKEKKQQSQQAQNENKKMKITKEELANIIKEEVEKALEEKKKDIRQDIEDQFRSKIAGPGRGMFGKIFQGLQGDDIAPNKQPSDDIETDADGIPLKAPFPPGIKTTKELIKNFSPKSDERKLFRKWYTKYGPGSKRKKTAAKPISKGKKLPNVKAPAYDPKKDKFAGSYPELDTPSGIDPVQHAMDRAYDAEVKGQYRVARRFFRFACKNDYKSKTSGKNTACAKVKEMTAKMNKGMGIQKGSDFDKSRSKSKTNPERRDKKKAKKVKTFDPKKGFVDDDGETAKQYKNLKKPNQKDTNPLAKDPAVDKKTATSKSQSSAKVGDNVSNAKKQYDILMSYDDKRQEFNKKIGVKNRTDYYRKLGVSGPGSKKGTVSIPDMGKFKKAQRKYQDAVRHYVRTGEVRNPLK
jgi:hypothetical protein